MKVLVIGASGFVGSRIVDALSGKPGIAVIAGVRRRRDALATRAIEQRVFDAGDAGATREAMAGITHAINCVMGDAGTMIAATRNITAAADAHGLTRLVHLSSIAVYGDASGSVTEDHAFSAAPDAYGAAKIACEALVREARTPAVILRPALIHGPGSEQWTARLHRLLKARRLGDLGAAGDGTCNLVPVADVAQAAIAALDHPAAAGRAFNLAMRNPPSWNRYLMDLARATGEVPVHRVTMRALKLETKLIAIPLKLAEIAKAKLKLSFLPVPDPITPGLARLFPIEVSYRSTAMDELIGGNETAYPDALRQAAAWLRGG